MIIPINDHVMLELFEKRIPTPMRFIVGRFTVTDTVTGDIVVADYNYTGIRWMKMVMKPLIFIL